MFEILATLGALGWIFWSVVVLFFAIAVVSVENEKFSLTTPVVVIGIALLIWLSGMHPLIWIKDHYVTLITASAVYLVFGVIYGMIRYSFYVHRIADTFAEWAHDNSYDVTRLTKKQASQFANHARVNNFPLEVADSKSRIIFWSIYWPFSAPWTLINEPVKRFFNFAYGRIAGLLQGIANRAFRNITIVDEPSKTDRQRLNG